MTLAVASTATARYSLDYNGEGYIIWEEEGGFSFSHNINAKSEDEARAIFWNTMAKWGVKHL